MRKTRIAARDRRLRRAKGERVCFGVRHKVVVVFWLSKRRGGHDPIGVVKMARAGRLQSLWWKGRSCFVVDSTPRVHCCLSVKSGYLGELGYAQKWLRAGVGRELFKTAVRLSLTAHPASPAC